MDRIENEKLYGLKISDNAETILNWDRPAGKKCADRRTRLLVAEKPTV
jgi:hypothetical protein